MTRQIYHAVGKAEGTQHDSYWRLSPYTDARITKVKLIQNLTRHNWRVKAADSRQNLIKAQQRLDRGTLCYEHESISNKDLVRFINDRKLDLPELKNSKQLIAVLRLADDSRSFHHFEDLPPEMRERIYSYHVAQFPPNLECPTQPPLARSNRLLREEILPVFYKEARFAISFVSLTDKERSGMAFKLYPDTQTTAWLQSLWKTLNVQFRHIRLRICAATTPNPRSLPRHNQPVLVLSYDVDVSVSGDTRWCKVRTRNAGNNGLPQYASRADAVEKTLASKLEEIFRDLAKKGMHVEDLFALRKAAEDGLGNVP